MTLTNGTRVLVRGTLPGIIVGGGYVQPSVQGAHRLESISEFYYIVQLEQGGWLGDEQFGVNRGREWVSSIVVHPSNLARLA